MKQLATFLLLSAVIRCPGQEVNERIILQLSQAPLLRVDAGSDVNLSESGSAVIGGSVYVTGGTAEFTYIWQDESSAEYYGREAEVPRTGIYKLTVTDMKNCTAVDSLKVLDYGTGLPPGSTGPLAAVYLDDARRTLSIELRQASGPVFFYICSLDGRAVYSGGVQGGAPGGAPGTSPAFSHQADLSGLGSGIYLVVIRDDRNKWVQKFILL
jgi:hypothetical protein